MPSLRDVAHEGFICVNLVLLGHSPPASLAGRRVGLKLGLMGTYGVQMQVILPLLVH
jgi:hypothetical protein